MLLICKLGNTRIEYAFLDLSWTVDIFVYRIAGFGEKASASSISASAVLHELNMNNLR